MKDAKKKAAAVAAVALYIKSQEELAAVTPAPSMETGKSFATSALPPAPVNFWGLSGRQTQMHLRTLMQLKTFQDFRKR